jgi:ligand-binding sensor domain-containing protein
MNSMKASLFAIIPSLIFVFCKSNYKNEDPKFLKTNSEAVKNMVFQSVDLGNSWQDISNGLPANLENSEFMTNGNELFIYSSKEVYHRNSNVLSPGWKKGLTVFEQGKVAICKSGLYTFTDGGKISKQINKTNLWSPVFSNLPAQNLRTIFETQKGTFLVGSDSGFYRSSDGGENWKLMLGGWVIKIVENNGVLVATSQRGIVRSTNDGETWETVISEGGVGIDVAVINGGFAAISYNTESKTRRVRTSYDNGKTWQAIDANLPPHDLIANVLEADNFLFVGHPKGIYKSADKGKTWTLVSKAIDDKVFNIYVSGKAIYAVPNSGGC